MDSQIESQFWASVDNSGDPAQYEVYLAKYPNGFFAELARIKINKLRSATPPSPPVTSPAPQPLPPTGSQPIPPANQPPIVVPVRDTLPPTAPGGMSNQPEPGLPPVLQRPTDPSDQPSMVTRAPPVDGEDDAKLKNLLDMVKPNQPQSTTSTPQTLPQAPQQAPQQVTQYGPVQQPQPQSQVANGYGQQAPYQVQMTQQPAPPPAPPPVVQQQPPQGAPYGGPAVDPNAQRQIAVGVLPPDFALPPRPIMVPVPQIVFPASFCSADARNAFHNNVYRPAVEAATRNNDLAGVYLRELQSIYDRYNLSGTVEPQNAVAAESRAYKQISDQAFFTQSALVNAYKALMAVPIISCDAPQ